MEDSCEWLAPTLVVVTCPIWQDWMGHAPQFMESWSPLPVSSNGYLFVNLITGFQMAGYSVGTRMPFINFSR
jgi:hypothetical protein